MNTYRIAVPAAFLGAWQPTRECWEDAIADGRVAGAEAADALDVMAALDRGEPRLREGCVVTVYATLVGPGQVRFLRQEAEYRWHYAGGGGNPFGVDPEDRGMYATERAACRRLMDRCDALLLDAGE